MSNDIEIKKCDYPHNETKIVLIPPKKLVKNDPYRCSNCGKLLYVTIERAGLNNLLSTDIATKLIISEEKIE